MATSSIYFFTKDITRKRTINYFEERGIKTKLERYSDLYARFYDMVVYIMYKQWVTNNYPLPKDEMIELVAKMITSGISSAKEFQ